MAMGDATEQGRKRKRESFDTPEVAQENEQASGSLDFKTMIEQSIQDGRRKRQQAKLEEQFLEEDNTEEVRRRVQRMERKGMIPSKIY
jgi:hypothetical protein